jgi:Holliday junction resolvase RusA-like endonuclease
MQTYNFTIPGAPVGKQRPHVNRKTGGIYGMDKSKEYKKLVEHCALEVGIKPVLTICHLDVRWRTDLTGEREDALEVTLVQTDDLPPKEKGKKKPDGDNALGCIADGLNCIAYLDDSQVWWWSLNRETI